MSSMGQYNPKLCCAHDWIGTKGTNKFRCSKCPAQCRKDKGMIYLYSAISISVPTTR